MRRGLVACRVLDRERLENWWCDHLRLGCSWLLDFGLCYGRSNGVSKGEVIGPVILQDRRADGFCGRSEGCHGSWLR